MYTHVLKFCLLSNDMIVQITSRYSANRASKHRSTPVLSLHLFFRAWSHLSLCEAYQLHGNSGKSSSSQGTHDLGVWGGQWFSRKQVLLNEKERKSDRYMPSSDSNIANTFFIPLPCPAISTKCIDEDRDPWNQTVFSVIQSKCPLCVWSQNGAAKGFSLLTELLSACPLCARGDFFHVRASTDWLWAAVADLWMVMRPNPLQEHQPFRPSKPWTEGWRSVSSHALPSFLLGYHQQDEHGRAWRHAQTQGCVQLRALHRQRWLAPGNIGWWQEVIHLRAGVWRLGCTVP